MIQKFFIDLADRSGYRAENIGYSFDRFNIAQCFSSGNSIIYLWQIDKYQITKLILCVVGKTDHSDSFLHFYPFM